MPLTQRSLCLMPLSPRPLNQRPLSQRPLSPSPLNQRPLIPRPRSRSKATKSKANKSKANKTTKPDPPRSSVVCGLYYYKGNPVARLLDCSTQTLISKLRFGRLFLFIIFLSKIIYWFGTKQICCIIVDRTC